RSVRLLPTGVVVPFALAAREAGRPLRPSARLSRPQRPAPPLATRTRECPEPERSTAPGATPSAPPAPRTSASPRAVTRTLPPGRLAALGDLLQKRFGLARRPVDGVAAAAAGADAVVAEALPRRRAPQHGAGVAVHHRQPLARRRHLPVVARGVGAAEEVVADHVDVRPARCRLLALHLRQRKLAQPLARRRVEAHATVADGDVDAVGRRDEVRAAG